MTDPTGTWSTRTPRARSDLFYGRWTREEEKYAEALMEEFRAGSLSIATGTKLRGYIAEKLDCFPKRVSKKYECSGYNGRQQYVNRVSEMDQKDLEKRSQKLEEMREKFAEKRAAVKRAKKLMKPRAASARADDQNIVEWARVQERELPLLMSRSISERSPLGLPTSNSLTSSAGIRLLLGEPSRYTGQFPVASSPLTSFPGENLLTKAILNAGSPLDRATGVHSSNGCNLTPSSSSVTPALDLDRMIASLNGPSPITGALTPFADRWLQAEVLRQSRSKMISEAIRAERENQDMLQHLRARRVQLERCLSLESAQREKEKPKRTFELGDAIVGAPKRMRYTSN